MRRYRFIFFFLLFSFIFCNTNEKKTTAKADINSATEFIRSALDGKFEQARIYLLPDSVNHQYMDAAERSYQKAEPATKTGYREASIRIHQVTYPVKDSVTIVIYSNSFKNDHDTLKVVRLNGQWLIDLKHLYEHSMDTVYLDYSDSTGR